MITNKLRSITVLVLMLMAVATFMAGLAQGQDEYVTLEFVDRYYIPGGTGYVIGGTVTWYYYGPPTTVDRGTNYFYASDYDAVSEIYDQYNNGGGQMPIPCRLLY